MRLSQFCVRRIFPILLLAVISCKSGTPEAESAPVPKPPAHKGGASAGTEAVAKAATARAQEAIEILISGIKTGDNTKVAESFESSAVVLTGSAHTVDEGDLVKSIGRIGPHDIVTDAKISKLVAGGNDDAVWVFAELAITKRNQEPGEKTTTSTTLVRVTELLTATSGWKVSAAASSELRTPKRIGGVSPIVNTTDTGPLAGLLVSPSKLDSALSSDPTVVFVAGEADPALGPHEAKKALSNWGKRSLSVNGAVREIRKSKWGFVQANVDWNEPGGKPYRLAVQLIALPQSDGSWLAVAIQFVSF